MRPLTILAVLLACLFFVPNADARRGCRGGACSAPAATVQTADLKNQPRAPKGGVTIDGKYYPGGQFISRADAAKLAAQKSENCKNAPVRAAGKKVLKGAARCVRKVLPPYRGCRGGRCG